MGKVTSCNGPTQQQRGPPHAILLSATGTTPWICLHTQRRSSTLNSAHSTLIQQRKLQIQTRLMESAVLKVAFKECILWILAANQGSHCFMGSTEFTVVETIKRRILHILQHQTEASHTFILSQQDLPLPTLICQRSLSSTCLQGGCASVDEVRAL